jgi:hypothetical protein
MPPYATKTSTLPLSEGGIPSSITRKYLCCYIFRENRNNYIFSKIELYCRYRSALKTKSEVD